MSAINHPQKTRSSEKEFSNQISQNAQSISSASRSSNITSQDKVSTATKKTINSEITTKEDRKFNVVAYGIQKCAKKITKNERLNHNLDSIITEGENSVNPLSIRDLLRLVKFNENSKNPHPILVKLNWVIIVSALLSKGKSLPKNVRIKPDMTPAERKIEPLLLKESWYLIQSGIDRKSIKIRYNKVLVQKNLHGQVINSTLFLSNMDSPNSLDHEIPNHTPIDTIHHALNYS